jgi:hypothetical protein
MQGLCTGTVRREKCMRGGGCQSSGERTKIGKLCQTNLDIQLNYTVKA